MKAIIAPIVVVAWLCATTIAHADVDGSVPSPGSCPYPSTGIFGAAGGEYDYACRFPVEINGSRHTTLFGGGMWQVTATVGVSFFIFNAGLSAQIPAGVLRGISYFACPDLSMAADPNPPGAWKNEIHPGPCKTLAPKPILIRPGDGASAPPGLSAPPLPPEPIAAPPDPEPAPSWKPGLSPAVTNPDNPNPDATTNSG